MGVPMTPSDMTRPPVERPVLYALIAKADWSHGPNVEPYAFTVINLLALRYYENVGWKFVALDPSCEQDWIDWRRANPEAA